jgi:ribosomal protein L11 methyltransferase
MILWQRRASSAWLAANEATLEQFARTRLAIVTVPGRAQALVQVSCSTRPQAKQLVEKFGGDFKSLARDWLPKARDHPPIQIGRHLQIVSASQRSTPEKQQLVIPAAGAFGTGEHATTAMSLRLLAQTVKKLPQCWRSLDAGTGTGILALAARKFGAEEVLGIDTDRRAVAHARQNAVLNCVARARFVAGDVLRWKSVRRYDVITANLYSELLIAALPRLRAWLRPNGWLIVSGVLQDQAAAIRHALKQRSFRLEQLRRRGKWVALSCQLAR